MALNDAPSVDTVQCLVLMRYVAAYMLAALGTKGDASPTAADVEKILSSVGIEAEADKVKKIVSELKGKNLEDLIEAGTKKLASVPSGGAAPAAAPAVAAAAPAEAKKEEKKAETESEDDDMGFGLFD